jgi:hypothetical protein
MMAHDWIADLNGTTAMWLPGAASGNMHGGFRTCDYRRSRRARRVLPITANHPFILLRYVCVFANEWQILLHLCDFSHNSILHAYSSRINQMPNGYILFFTLKALNRITRISVQNQPITSCCGAANRFSIKIFRTRQYQNLKLI